MTAIIDDSCNLQSSLTAMISTGFEKQQQYTQQLESKIDDFLEGRIAFQMTPVKLSHLVNTEDGRVYGTGGFQY
ncbi:hypothetical protein E4U13_007215 [Claviceps humidiphila]|uniref:Uncharacterized protein n=1 Tax=Claviceps humidiphila TaxID=1294629 RepID=A0A9P7TWL5_9HYPO|nr:hypothetical protein E4U13_007215 [Claviceps humidiphila]